MKKTFLLSAALVAILAAPALAQDRGNNDDRRGGQPPAAARGPAPQAQRGPAPQAQRGPAPQAQRGPAPQAAPPAQRGPAPAPQRAANPPPNRGNYNRGSNGRDFGRNDNNRAQSGNNAPRPNVSNNTRPSFNGNANNRPNGARPNPSYAQYNRAFNAPQRFRYRGPAYYPPAGFYYRRWSYGDFLPNLFWASNYWINDFSYYELMPPPPGTVWVRYGSDALLIDRYTGEIIQVEYNVFY